MKNGNCGYGSMSTMHPPHMPKPHGNDHGHLKTAVHERGNHHAGKHKR